MLYPLHFGGAIETTHQIHLTYTQLLTFLVFEGFKTLN